MFVGFGPMTTSLIIPVTSLLLPVAIRCPLGGYRADSKVPRGPVSSGPEILEVCQVWEEQKHLNGGTM